MATRRKAMRLPRDEDALLRQLYLDFRIPIDQYAKPQRRAELEALVRSWNDATGRDDSAEDVLRYMMNMRKSGKKGPGWPTFDGDYDQGERIKSRLNYRGRLDRDY